MTQLSPIFSRNYTQRVHFLSHSESSITLMPKPNKDITRRENYRQISLMNTDVNILNKVLANQIHQCIKRVIDHDQVDFILGIQAGLTFEKSMDISPLLTE